MDKSHETDNVISIDIALDNLDNKPISVDVVVEEEKDFVRLKNNRVKKVADFFGSKAKAIKDADLFKSIETLQEENPNCWIFVFSNKRIMLDAKKKREHSYKKMPYRKYFFHSNNDIVNYSAETVEQKVQHFKIEQNGRPVSEIREINPTLISVVLNGYKIGNLVKTNSNRGWTVYTCGNLLIREKWTGYIEITTANGSCVASIVKSGIKQVLKCSKDIDLTVVITLILAVNAFHNIQMRLSNPDAPYVIEYVTVGGDG